MEKPRELFETELAAIREELLRLGVCPRESPTKLAARVRSEQTVTPRALMAAAYELAGYAVATLALGRNVPNEVVLKEVNEFDLGKVHVIRTRYHLGRWPYGWRARSQ